MATVSLQALLKVMVEQDASDLHITESAPPEMRINGRMTKVKLPPLTKEATQSICYSILTQEQVAEFEEKLELDFSIGIKGLSRFRVNLFIQKGAVGGVFRRIPEEIPHFEALGLPPVLKRIIQQPNGLILVTGPTGSGKSTTLASLLDMVNETEFGHILTIEDPVEFVHPHKNCIVNQREVGSDTHSFADALKRVLRQDPDYILVGELRDVETIELALTLAETGHLVFATLHTNSTIQSVNRIINVFPPHQQPQIRQLLSFTLQAVFSQQLISRADQTGRAMAYELLVPNAAIRNLIREDKLHQVYSMMQAGQTKSGMATMNQCLANLLKEGKITREDAFEYSTVREELTRLLG
jgi:twitching motility protein PilT